MTFTVLIPARLASSRLPNKPLADIHNVPMVVRVAQRASLSTAARVVVAADSPAIVAACETHGVAALLTRTDHPSGSDRLAEACNLLGLGAQDIVVNVQGDEPLIDPALIDAVALLLGNRADCSRRQEHRAVLQPRADTRGPRLQWQGLVGDVQTSQALTARWHLWLPRGFPANVSDLAASTTGTTRITRTTPCAVAWPPHCRSHHLRFTGRWR